MLEAMLTAMISFQEGCAFGAVVFGAVVFFTGALAVVFAFAFPLADAGFVADLDAGFLAEADSGAEDMVVRKGYGTGWGSRDLSRCTRCGGRLI